jgi:hypothetical protein
MYTAKYYQFKLYEITKNMATRICHSTGRGLVGYEFALKVRNEKLTADIFETTRVTYFLDQRDCRSVLLI